MKRFVSSFLALTLCLIPALMPAKKASAVTFKEALNKTTYCVGSAKNATKAFF